MAKNGISTISWNTCRLVSWQLLLSPFITAQTAVVKTEGDKKVGKHIHDGIFSFFTEKILEF